MPQGCLSFNYAPEVRQSGTTSLAGLPTYLELASVLGLAEAVDRHLHLRSSGQGYTDRQMVLSLVLLNPAVCEFRIPISSEAHAPQTNRSREVDSR